MKKTFLLLLPVAMLLQSCEEGTSPYKDADKVSGSIKEISFVREVPCEDGYMGCYDYTVCEENKVERTFVGDVQICVEIVEGPVIAKSDYINLQFSIDMPDDISGEFLYPVDEFFGDFEISDKSAMATQAYFHYSDEKSHYNSISCMSKSAGLMYVPGLDYENGECVENASNASASIMAEISYFYVDRDVNIRGEHVNLKFKKGWNRFVSRNEGEWTAEAQEIEEIGLGFCQCVIPGEASTDDIPSDCEWVIIRQ